MIIRGDEEKITHSQPKRADEIMRKKDIRVFEKKNVL